MLSRGSRHGEEMCFVASGAVAVHLPDGTTIELGSGEFFGELAPAGREAGRAGRDLAGTTASC